MYYLRLTSVMLLCAYFWYYLKTYTEWHFIDTVNLVFHEAGHAIFSFFGEFVHVAAGSAFQILLPLFIAGYFFYHQQKISSAICLLWVGQNFLNVSVYAGDAIQTQLELLGGDSSIHDWNYLLSTLDILKDTPVIASILFFIGTMFILIGTILAVYFTLKTKDAFKTEGLH